MPFQNGRLVGTISRFEAVACSDHATGENPCALFSPFLYNLDNLSPWQHTQVNTITTQESLPLHPNVACPLNNKAEYQQLPIAWPLHDPGNVAVDFDQNTDDSFDFSEYIRFDEDDEPAFIHSSQSDVDTETSEECALSPDAPFACPDCGKQFSRYRDYARRHKKVHEGQKTSYECHLCEKTFGRMDSLQRHLQKKACPKLKGRDIRIVPTDPTVYIRTSF
ncbi:hypothetical protein BJV82DRAFT_718326 [Fennellomyces sp. T-0311]|nr:hypothetical protein BJV82DRAFT_718326 [Fennellomyces sp. T-0311]